jgi:hypothetical protein
MKIEVCRDLNGLWSVWYNGEQIVKKYKVLSKALERASKYLKGQNL